MYALFKFRNGKEWVFCNKKPLRTNFIRKGLIFHYGADDGT